MPVDDYRPTLEQVGEIDAARTVDESGNITGTFSDPAGSSQGTKPTATQVNDLIDRSLQEVEIFFGTDIPDVLFDNAAYVVAIRTAFWIELTYYAAEVMLNRSPYPEYKLLFDELRQELVNAIQAVEGGGDIGDTLSQNMPQWAFPADIDILERPF